MHSKQALSHRKIADSVAEPSRNDRSQILQSDSGFPTSVGPYPDLKSLQVYVVRGVSFLCALRDAMRSLQISNANRRLAAPLTVELNALA